MGGLMAIKKGEAHLAGIGLFNPETHTYNVPYINEYLAGVEVVLLSIFKSKARLARPGR